MQVIKLDITTNGSGAATITHNLALPALLYAVEWVKGTFDTGVDATISCTGTLGGVKHALLTLTDANADKIYYPRHVEHTAAGANGTALVMPLINGLLEVVIASGGNVKAGSVIFYTA